MENHFYHIRLSPLNVTIFITYMRNCVMGAMPMEGVIVMDLIDRKMLMYVSRQCLSSYYSDQVHK